MVQQNIELGACRVLINDADIGRTRGPVRLTIRALWRDRRSDRTGASVTDRVALGTELCVTLRLGEKTLTALEHALPQATAAIGYQSLGRTPGFKASTVAESLRLHPEERSDAGRDVLLHKAVATGVVELTYGPGADRSLSLIHI